MARKLTQADLDDLEEIESADPYLQHLLSRYQLLSEYDDN